jgi:hypothetical protein
MAMSNLSFAPCRYGLRYVRTLWPARLRCRPGIYLLTSSTRSADYRDIDPRYGTLKDWDELLHDVHERGMKLM